MHSLPVPRGIGGKKREKSERLETEGKEWIAMAEEFASEVEDEDGSTRSWEWMTAVPEVASVSSDGDCIRDRDRLPFLRLPLSPITDSLSHFTRDIMWAIISLFAPSSTVAHSARRSGVKRRPKTEDGRAISATLLCGLVSDT